MQDIFDITEKEIQELTDSDLRTLIGLLCEAELERNDLPVTAAKWGGNQRAADGGLDVYVDLENPTEAIGEIPRWKTGIQVKQESMPKSKIKKEMSLDGAPKPILAELARNKGAYLIACGRDTNSDKMLKERLKAMRDSCESIPEKADLHLDFFDSNRIATWTRKHPSLVLWVKANLGTNSSGWQPHDNWSECPDGIDGEFILDDSSKIYDDRSKDTDGLSAEDGLNSIRALLHEERSCIRLAGLSGVGKTRFAQALFDERAGQNPLPKSIACYTDIGIGPSPTPLDMAMRLINSTKRAILIVDNCPPDLHEEISKVCTRADSKISLLTIEYDIQGDKPERTEVFRMEPSSNDLIEKLISSRFKEINNIEARRIAEFSKGNARIAIALAETFEKGDAILTLENNELFKRLFHQRNAEDDSLMRAAEVLSLVYSFNGDDESLGSSDSELDKLSELVGISSIDLYRHVSTLLKRGLAQKRSKWRAVLPHAIANRLAKQALENIPRPFIKNIFDKDESGRLLKSYTRRLGYLHDSEAAKKIAKGWLRPGGWLGDISKLNEFGITLLINIAPAAQEDTLEAIERAADGSEEKDFASKQNPHYTEITRLLQKLAYDPHLFKRSCLILLKFAATEKPNDNYNSITDLTSSLFYLKLSGTHATVEQRLEILSECVAKESPFSSMALPILNGLLQSNSFTSGASFEFGARPRDYGYLPKTWGEVTKWYNTSIIFVRNTILNNSDFADDFKIVLAKHLRFLWKNANAMNELEKTVIAINSNGFWKEGWLAIRRAIFYDTKRLHQDSLSRLLKLEKKIAPKDLFEEAQIYALTERWGALDSLEYEDGKSRDLELVTEHTLELAQKTAINIDVLQKLLPSLVSTHGNTSTFGQGLAVGCSTPEQIWNLLLNASADIQKEKREYAIFLGFLNGMRSRDVQWFNSKLDHIVNDNILAPYFPSIQCNFENDQEAARRLFEALELNIAATWQYNRIWALEIENLTFANLLSKVMATPEGTRIALDILGMRFFHKKKSHLDYPLQVLGRNLCIELCEIRINDNAAYHMDKIIQKCFAYHSSTLKAKELCHKIIKKSEESIAAAHYFESTIVSLIKVQPKTVLTELLLNYENGIRYFSWRTYHDKSAINLAPLSSVVEWCEIDPSTRYPLVTQITPLFVESDGNVESISPVAEMLLNKSEAYPEILEFITPHFYPTTGWSGELSIVAATRTPFFEQLKGHQHQCVRNWASEQLTELNKRIARQKIAEEKEAKARHESFE
ncbi:hypothetical protein [Maridesulfovibrio sp.]|uniref:hypothetical protein n=1 Tax=Maridesulfovibrio sp. TaxID=2795000 RepID=UPI003B006549